MRRLVITLDIDGPTVETQVNRVLSEHRVPAEQVVSIHEYSRVVVVWYRRKNTER